MFLPLILQLEEEKSRLLSRKRDLEQEHTVWREQLAHLEQELACLRAEKKGLEQSLQAAEEKQEHLEGEMALLRRERVQLQDHIMQVQNVHLRNVQDLVVTSENCLNVNKSCLRSLWSFWFSPVALAVR